MNFLKQSTSVVVLVGPVLDASGAAVTTAAIEDFTLTKNGTSAAMSGNTINHSHNGHYEITLTTTDTNTIGRLSISTNNTLLAMPVFRWDICQPTVYDALFTKAVNATGGLPVATAAITALAGSISTYAGADTSGITTLLGRLPSQISLSDGKVTVGTNSDKDSYALSEESRDAIIADFLAYVITKGTAGTIERAFWQAAKAQASASGEVSGTPTASAFDTDLTATSGAFDHLLIVFTSGSLAGEARPIDTYVSADGRITLQEALTAAPAATDEFIIVPSHIHKISDIQNGLATDTAVADVYDLAAWLLTTSVGAISNAQSSAESFELILGGTTYTVTGSGMTETGNRSTTTLSKV